MTGCLLARRPQAPRSFSPGGRRGRCRSWRPACGRSSARTCNPGGWEVACGGCRGGGVGRGGVVTVKHTRPKDLTCASQVLNRASVIFPALTSTRKGWLRVAFSHSAVTALCIAWVVAGGAIGEGGAGAAVFARCRCESGWRRRRRWTGGRDRRWREEGTRVQELQERIGECNVLGVAFFLKEMSKAGGEGPLREQLCQVPRSSRTYIRVPRR
jgi:hypothetical protein